MSEVAVPPHSIEAEQALLGAAFVEPACLNEVGLIVKSPDMFFRETHRHVWRAINEMAASGQGYDWVSAVDAVERLGVLEQCGGRDTLYGYLREVSSALPSAFGAESYAQTVRDKWLLRKIIQAAAEMQGAALNPTNGPADILGEARARIDEIADGCISNEPVPIEAAVAEASAEARAGGIVGQTAGIRSLDAITSGFRGGQLITVGGRPGEGKSALMTQMADHHQASGSNVLFVSLEMSHREISERLVSMRAGIDSRRYRHWTLSVSEQAAAIAAENSLRGHLWIDDTFSMTVEDIAMKTRRLHARHKLNMLIVDYIQLVRTNSRLERHLQIGEATRRLKSLARELDIPVVVGAQLNRDSTKEKRRPTLADLRESGSIEQDSDHVLLLHWPADGDIGNVARVEVAVAKNRGGPTGTVLLNFNKTQTRFTEDVPDFLGGGGR